MLSTKQIKLICSLQQKKYRDLHGLFVVEGKKMVQELIESHSNLLNMLVLSDSFVKSTVDFSVQNAFIVDDKTFDKLSNLVNHQGILAVFKKVETQLAPFRFALALDGVQDPGNMGTILRMADWFGVQQIICSNDCVDIFNPKVVQSSMGAVMRTKVFYTPLADFFRNNKLPVFGAFLEGENVYHQALQPEGILVLGSEGNGISPAVSTFINNKLHIPKIGGGESLNVSIATAIFLSEFHRNA